MGQTKPDHIQISDIVDLVINSNQIEQHNIPEDELFYLKIDNQTLGPVWEHNLAEFLQNNTLDPEITVRNFTTKNWIAIYDHPRFSRRRPSVVKRKKISQGSRFYYLESGIKKGPISISKLKSKLHKKQLLQTDIISTDEGTSWASIHEYTEFDRRLESPTDNLPESPPLDLNTTTIQIVKNKQENHEKKTDIVANLAEITRYPSEEKNNETDEDNPTGILKTRPVLYIMLLLFTITGFYIGFFIWKSIQNDENTEPIDVKQDENKVTTPTVKKTIRNKVRPKNNIIRYKHEDSDPVKLDPIRKKLSKETLDPYEDEIGESDEDKLMGEHGLVRKKKTSFLDKLKRAVEDENIDSGEDYVEEEE